MSSLTENVAKVTAAHAALKTAIAAKGVPVPDGTKLSGMPALVEQIETGGTAEPNFPRVAFAGDDSRTLNIPEVIIVRPGDMTNLASCFSSCGSVTTLTLPPGFGQAARTLNDCFGDCFGFTSLTLPPGFGQAATNVASCFRNCRYLVSLHLPPGFGMASTWNYNCFGYCNALTTITGNPNFKASVSLSTSTQLNHDSLMVVINGLQTVTTTQTLTLGTTNLAKLTDEEKKVATDKGWTLA